MRASVFGSVLCSLAVMSPAAFASDYILDIGEEVRLEGIAGGWGRAFPAGGGDWYYLFGGGGDYRLLDLTADFQFDYATSVGLTGRQNSDPDRLIDHAITKCPDGSYLHVASGEISEPDDSAWGFRYDASWNKIAEADIDVDNPDYSHNDLPVLCSEQVDMAIFQPNIDAEAAVFLLDDDLSPITHNITMTPVPPVPGSSLIYDYDADTIIRIGAPEIETEDSLPRNKLIVFTVYWDQAEPYEVKTDVDLTSAGIGYDWHAYWPQGIQRIGDFYLVAHMARPVDGGYNQDDGNLFLQLFDQNFNVIETHQLTDDGGPFANQRPSLTLQDDILLVTYDKRIETNQNSEGELSNHVMAITLDMDALNAGSPNLAPTAYAGADFNGAIDALATLDGSGSSDPDNDELSFTWSFSFVPDESGLTDEDIVNRLTDEAQFVPDALGDYKLLLTVSDGEAEDTDEVIVTVVENLSPVADAGGNQSVGLTESVLLDGSASEDPDGDELSYLWYFESLPEASALTDTDISAAASAIAAFAPDVEGTYEVTLMVTDGTFEATDTVEITVGSGGCACASAPTPLAAASWASVLMGLLVLRRRERE